MEDAWYSESAYWRLSSFLSMQPLLYAVPPWLGIYSVLHFPSWWCIPKSLAIPICCLRCTIWRRVSQNLKLHIETEHHHTLKRMNDTRKPCTDSSKSFLEITLEQKFYQNHLETNFNFMFCLIVVNHKFWVKENNGRKIEIVQNMVVYKILLKSVHVFGLHTDRQTVIIPKTNFLI